jgi:signal transduction histidine kinase
VSQLLAETHQQISNILHRLPADDSLNFEKEGLFETLRRMISLELPNWFDSVEWQLEPGAVSEAARLPTVSSSVLYYALREVIRNAAKHGRGSNEQQPLSLTICAQYRDRLAITVEDNGVGLANSSSSTSNGQGLGLHSTMLAIIGGELQIDSVPGSFTRVTINLKPIFTETS